MGLEQRDKVKSHFRFLSELLIQEPITKTLCLINAAIKDNVSKEQSCVAHVEAFQRLPSQSRSLVAAATRSQDSNSQPLVAHFHKYYLVDAPLRLRPRGTRDFEELLTAATQPPGNTSNPGSSSRMPTMYSTVWSLCIISTASLHISTCATEQDTENNYIYTFRKFSRTSHKLI